MHAPAVPGLQNRGAAIFEFAQITEALFEIAQLRVVQVAGDFLAVSRNKRHRRAFVKKLYRCGHLAYLHAELGGNTLGNDACYVFRHLWFEGRRPKCIEPAILPQMPGLSEPAMIES
jgi:hypothetical protein